MTTDERSLDDDALTYLAKAGSWGLLRSLRSQKVCMTGKMSMTRYQLARLVDAAGGVFTNVMSGSTTLLIVSEADRYSTKVQRAQDLGTRLMTEHEFAAELLPTVEELVRGDVVLFGAPR